MGVAESKPQMQPPFQRLSEWTLGRVEKLLSDYYAKDLDFGLDYHALSLLLDGDKEWSEQIIKAFGSPNGLINVLSFITGAALAVMGDSQEKAALCFKAFDFSGTGTISLDETTIMFMCALRGFVVITGQGSFPEDDSMEITALDVYRTYDKDNYSKLTKDEFLRWTATKLNGYHVTDLSPEKFLQVFGLASNVDSVTADIASVSLGGENQEPPPSATTERTDTAYSQDSFIST